MHDRAAKLRDGAGHHDGAADSLQLHLQAVADTADGIAQIERKVSAPKTLTCRTIDLSTPAPPPETLLAGLSRRVTLTPPELRLVAECAGGARPVRPDVAARGLL